MRDIVMFDLLICAIEDCPQFCIVLNVGIYDGFNVISLITLAASIALLFWKIIIRIFVNYCGCQNDVIEIDHYNNDNIALSTKDINSQQQAIVQVNDDIEMQQLKSY